MRSTCSWVWHSTPATKAAEKLSVLAVVETVLACIGYWWFAFYCDTHWHLLASILIAPLLLLRSPHSIEKGVEWFLSDSLRNVPDVLLGCPLGLSLVWGALFGLPTGVLSHRVCALSAQEFLFEAAAWRQAFYGFYLGALTTAVGATLSLTIRWAIAGPKGSNVNVESAIGCALAASVVGVVVGGTIGIASCGGVAVASVVVGVVFGVVAGTSLSFAGGVGFGLGLVLRSLTCRVAATLRYFWRGWSCLPANWRENSLLTDCTLVPELMPGIRERYGDLNLESLYRDLDRDNLGDPNVWVSQLPPMAIMFVPTVLYRISIKATAWFWWPLAVLLKPVSSEGTESGEKDLLTWPWRNPAQKTWIMVSIVLTLITLPGYFLDANKVTSLMMPTEGRVGGVPLIMRVAQAVGWDGVRPWHWAMAVIAGCSTGMLWVGGRAVQKDENKHWDEYRRTGLQRDLWCMDLLGRLRLLATLFFWGAGVLALLLETNAIPELIPLPPRQTELLRAWFAGRA